MNFTHWTIRMTVKTLGSNGIFYSPGGVCIRVLFIRLCHRKSCDPRISEFFPNIENCTPFSRFRIVQCRHKYDLCAARKNEKTCAKEKSLAIVLLIHYFGGQFAAIISRSVFVWTWLTKTQRKKQTFNVTGLTRKYRLAGKQLSVVVFFSLVMPRAVSLLSCSLWRSFGTIVLYTVSNWERSTHTHRDDDRSVEMAENDKWAYRRWAYAG